MPDPFVASRRPLLGVFACLPSAVAVELVAVEGFDYVSVDWQHGLIDYGDVVALLQAASAAGVPALVRGPSTDPSWIGRALDAGAVGVIVPQVETPAEAARAVAACRYPPVGTRSYGPLRAARVLGDELDELAAARCFVMVESATAAASVETITTVEGLDGVYVGTTDLALSMGLAPGMWWGNHDHEAHVRAVLEACRARDLLAGIHALDGAQAHHYATADWDLVSVGTDLGLLTSAARAQLARARQH
jgi:4-hydroxy-2-oxoheptanedioate aldolase